MARLSKNDIESFVCTLRPETAAALHHVMLAQEVQAKIAKEEGFPALLNSFEVIRPFCDAVALYLDKNFK